MVTDEQLLARVAQRDEASLAALYDRYGGPILGFTQRILGERMVAEEVLQEAFWRVWRHADSYDSQRGSVATWLYTIARRLAIDALRRREARPPLLPGGDEPLGIIGDDDEPDVLDCVDARLRHERLRVALEGLPQRQREVIELAYFRGYTRREIAEITGQPVGTVHTRARLALIRLRRDLDEPRAVRAGPERAPAPTAVSSWAPA